MLLFNVCCSENNKEKAETAQQNLFIQYLEETFNIKDSIEERMFIIIPCSGCSGCEQLTFSIFIDKLLEAKDYMMIICNPAEKGLLLPSIYANNIKYDFMGIMTNYDFGHGYPTCIVVKKNEVVENYTLTPDVLHWINKFNSVLPSQKASRLYERH